MTEQSEIEESLTSCEEGMPSASPPGESEEVAEAQKGDGEPAAIVPEAIGDGVVRIPNVTLPCPEGICIDAMKCLPADVNCTNVAVDYVFGRHEFSNGILRIFPVEPGEQEVGITYLRDGVRRSVLLKVLVNQDPRKLWRIVDPPEDAPYRKELYVSRAYGGGDARFIAASRRGRTHEHAGTFRDDDFGFWASEGNDCFLVAVADGAGSAKYSREGSRRAVESAIGYLSPRLGEESVWETGETGGEKDGKVAQMLVSAAYNAMTELGRYCGGEDAKASAGERPALKDFNTTLLLAAVRILPSGERRIVAFSIGDGAIAWVEPGRSELLCAPDGGEYSGQTQFLTTTPVWAKAAEDWGAFRAERVFAKVVEPEAARRGFLALMTDGVSDAFFGTDAMLKDASAWDDFALKAADVDEGERTLKNIFGENDGEAGARMLLDWLGFWSRGNHDDRTLAILAPAVLVGAYGAD